MRLIITHDDEIDNEQLARMLPDKKLDLIIASDLRNVRLKIKAIQNLLSNVSINFSKDLRGEHIRSCELDERTLKFFEDTYRNHKDKNILVVGDIRLCKALTFFLKSNASTDNSTCNSLDIFDIDKRGEVSILP
ncbi:hypothetical protein BVX95_01420 [archaeon D22]|nr:hypothetical protein BVX95_01420 [archaeon D22]